MRTILGEPDRFEAWWSARIVVAVAALGMVRCSRAITSSSSLLDPEYPRSASSTMSISAAGVDPGVLHLNAPATVTFTNNDTAAHRLEPAPELGYGDCTQMNQLGTLQPGQSGQVTIAQSQFICAFQDSAAPSNVTFQGFIVVH